MYSIPSLAASIHIGNTPFILFNFPSKESSPIKTNLSIFRFCIISFAINIPTAIGKSKKVPSFFVSAGAKLIIILLLFSSIPIFLIAVRMRSFASLMLTSGNPTTFHSGIPFATSTCTDTKYPSRPCKDILLIIASIYYLLFYTTKEGILFLVCPPKKLFSFKIHKYNILMIFFQIVTPDHVIPCKYQVYY